ncbi:unnamed protein product [Allacma fusca]|uniref:Uncharacterized protein n=1 Tax=Allacma fusca TaxID=39272 RepID=A0A8J2P357_9HEXA|nr:unnamed protein product [Allacma fusca]
MRRGLLELTPTLNLYFCPQVQTLLISPKKILCQGGKVSEQPRGNSRKIQNQPTLNYNCPGFGSGLPLKP